MFNLKRINYEAFATVPDAFAGHELEIIRGMIKSVEKTTAAVGGGGTEITDKEVRDSRIKWIEPEPKVQWIYERLATVVTSINEQWFGMDLTHTENIQLTEYDSEYHGFYDAHIDCSYGMTASRNRKLSITMQLSDTDDYEGGDLLLYPENIKNPVIASRALGSMTLFRSHVIHEVVPVTKGVRYSFVTWVNGPLFK